MKDLVIEYSTTKGSGRKEYDHIFDFTHDVENLVVVPEFDATFISIKATFFENPLNTKEFERLGDLYWHCKNIMK